jgi:hypothetical protein
MAARHSPAIPVIDFRRQSMSLEWHASSGKWSACTEAPALVHGIALIRAAQPNICVYGHGGQLHLQVGTDQYTLAESTPQLKFVRDSASFGLRRRLVVEAASGDEIFSHAYWNGQGDDFFRWLTMRTGDMQWRIANGRLWSDGVEAAVLRAS